MDQDERRHEEATYEQTRLQTIGAKLMQELSEAQREHLSTVASIRQKAEQEIALYEKKAKINIASIEKNLNKNDSLLKSVRMTLLNLERELNNKRMTLEAEKRDKKEHEKNQDMVEARKKKVRE